MMLFDVAMRVVNADDGGRVHMSPAALHSLNSLPSKRPTDPARMRDGTPVPSVINAEDAIDL
jgi:hypothetical protein